VSAVQAAWTQSSWVSSNDDTSDPGWMLPIIVLCRVYATYLNTTPDTHTHRQQRPLPLDQLYNPDSPAAGLLPLLKFALWQVLWVESPSSECLVAVCHFDMRASIVYGSALHADVSVHVNFCRC